MISWLPPGEPNGEILGYSLYMKTMEKGRQFTQDFSLGPHINYYTMSGLHQVRSKGSLGNIHILRTMGLGAWVQKKAFLLVCISTYIILFDIEKVQKSAYVIYDWYLTFRHRIELEVIWTGFATLTFASILGFFMNSS